MRTVPLRRVAAVLNGGTPTADLANWAGPIPWATPVDLAGVNGSIIDSTGRTLSREGLQSGSTLAPAGSVLVSTRAPIGYTARNVVPMAFNQGCKAASPIDGYSPRFLQYALIALTAAMQAAGSGSTFLELSTDAFSSLPVPVASEQEQRRIADFLDDRVARIDQIIAARRQQSVALEESLIRASFDAISGNGESGRRGSGLPWLGAIPATWPVLTVATEFQVDLGKMLDEKRQTGASSIPYLRNSNVQWDRVDIADLKSMDILPEERGRYGVRPGDLLVCEGGQPGRAAVWSGSVTPLGFQKALHRVRSRGRSRPEWLLECLRAAVHLNVFAIENGQTTIGHLTNEQLRSLRLPFPDPYEQDRLLELLHARQSQVRSIIDSLGESTALFQEYKQSLITAAVAGAIDVTTVGSRIPAS